MQDKFCDDRRLTRGEALLVLVGITAGPRARRRVWRFFSRHSDYAVFVPALPYRRGIRACSAWLQGYLENTVRPSRYAATHVIAYIAGGLLLRSLPARALPVFERMVQFRGPIQERVAPALERRLGRGATGWLKGRAVLDLADGWPQALPRRRCARHEGLIIELGRSRLARLLGVSRANIGAEAWMPARLQPTAEAVLRIAASHDDVYASESVLSAALAFIRSGHFPMRQESEVA